jgi:transcriptional regulator with AAA-type ATPase domain
MAALVFISGPSLGLRREITDELTIGRSASCEIALDDDKVSRQHARIELDGGELKIRDLGSRNGTRVNGKRIRSELRLVDGDQIQFGDSTARLELEVAVIAAELERPDVRRWSIESLLAEPGADRDLQRSCIDLMQASTEAAILSCATASVVERLHASRAAAFLVRGGLALTRIGAGPLDASPALIRDALDRRDLVRAGPLLCIPIFGHRERLGAICIERDGELIPSELKLAAVLGHLSGEALAALRFRGRREPPVLIGSASNFRRLVERAGRVARGDEPVGISGESGSGRRLIAQYIHSHSTRSSGPLITVNCSAQSEAEEELFGVQDGLARSAIMRAEGGALILRNVELLRRPAALRLARFLRSGSASGVDGSHPVDARMFAIGHQPLDVLAAQGKIPEELAAFPSASLQVPALRDRSADVPALFKHFAHERSQQMGREPPRPLAEARKALTSYAWPGNITELSLIAERIALLYPGLEVPVTRLPAEVLQSTPAGGRVQTLQHRVRALERSAIAEALSATGGKKIRAAEILGISRPTLDKKLRELRLTGAGAMEREE